LLLNLRVKEFSLGDREAVGDEKGGLKTVLFKREVLHLESLLVYSWWPPYVRAQREAKESRILFSLSRISCLVG
jgi:hypothetical protein